MKTVGISLSGGGSRGIVHIGILKALDEAGIKMSMVSGTSAGAIVGLFYCSGYSPDNIMEIIRETKLIRYVRPAISLSGLLKLESIKAVFSKYIKVDSFSNLQIPLVVSATDVVKGTNRLFTDGPLIQSVLASCALPVIFQPIKVGNDVFIDGGVLNNLPVEPVVEHCDLTIGSNCNPVSEVFQPTNMRSVLERSLLLAINVNTLSKIPFCDFFFEPTKVKDYRGFDFSKSDEIFKIGYEYGKYKVEEVMKKLQMG
jgi:NTE family protein